MRHRLPRHWFESHDPINSRLASAAARKSGVSGCPSNWCTNWSATVGWRRRIMARLSHQLAQHAGLLVLAALLKPMPPNTMGSEPKLFASSTSANRVCTS